MAWTTLTLAVMTLAVSGSDAREVVQIRLRGHFFAEPATVQITVAIEPASNQRLLRVSADGASYYRASEVTLDGERDKRLHVVEFRNLPAGDYMLTAEVMSSDAILGKATQGLVVTSTGGR